MIEKINIFRDLIFKIGLLLLGIIFLVIYWGNSQNGRYQYISEGTYIRIFDKQLGIIIHAVVGTEVFHLEIKNMKTTDKTTPSVQKETTPTLSVALRGIPGTVRHERYT